MKTTRGRGGVGTAALCYIKFSVGAVVTFLKFFFCFFYRSGCNQTTFTYRVFTSEGDFV